MSEITKDTKLVIELREWDHTCGDGCCYTTGTEIFINGEKVEHPEIPFGSDHLEDPATMVQAILKHLGFTGVEVTNTYDYGENEFSDEFD